MESNKIIREDHMELGATLFVYKGEWGLPTIDFECMRALCLVKFTGFPIKIDTSGDPLRSGGGQLPYLQIGSQKFVGYSKIKMLLDKENYPIDKELSGKSKDLSQLYSNWVFNNLHCYYHYFMFGEPENMEKSRTLYAKRTRFPFQFYYPAKYQKAAKDIISILGDFDVNDKLQNHNAEYLLTMAKQCVNTLSRKLGDRVCFFGNIYSELDGIVYSYLAILSHIDLSNNPLKNHIAACRNLVSFINRITLNFFHNEGFDSVKEAKAKKGATNYDPMLTPMERRMLETETRNKIIAAAVAVLAISTFSIFHFFFLPGGNSDRRFYEVDENDDYDLD